MICSTCAEGADHAAKFNNRAVAQAYHDTCAGCDCQHDVDAQLSGKAIQR